MADKTHDKDDHHTAADSKAADAPANPNVPDPYKKVPEPKKAVHEEALKSGKVPLPAGHKLNPGEGTIPRSPGEWPTGPNPPENPLGTTAPGIDRPASEPLETQKRVSAEAKENKDAADAAGRAPNAPDLKKK